MRDADAVLDARCISDTDAELLARSVPVTVSG
jgi:hypothetical protein